MSWWLIVLIVLGSMLFGALIVYVLLMWYLYKGLRP